MTDTPGSLHLGRILEPGAETSDDDRLRIDRGSLTTHGVIVGMTGSGKTGLGVVLLEEILGSGVPALILDPKGDMGNLLLNFPDLEADDFEPWVDAAEAKREGMEPSEFAAKTAAKWKKGLAGSGIDGERMRALRDRVDFRIFTPGSTAGTPLNLVGDLSAPTADWDADAEVLRDEIEGLVSGLLVMAGIEADPLTSREHILLSNLVEHAWRAGQRLDLATLIGQIASPPLRRLGVFELDTFYPTKDRMKLAMRLNGLVASPSFAEWMKGPSADIETLLYAPDGRPRAGIIYLSHLTEDERQFVVTLLLSRLITWMRKQPGTSDLRALVYADEVMGFAPPTAQPPTKKPILTLFKQARAHGVGMVLSTQNPVDLDYKLMSNAGTWMVGRLQTERDKARIIEGLKSASGDVDVSEWDARIGQLGKREFLLKTAKSATPRLFTTRWAMSYLRGPLARPELKRLTEEAGPVGTGGPSADSHPAGRAGEGRAGTSAPQGTSDTSGAADLAPDESPVEPVIADGVQVRYLAADAPWRRDLGVGRGTRRLAPGLAARIHMVFDERVGDIREEEEWEAIFFPLGEPFDPSSGVAVDYDDRDFQREPPEDATWRLGDVPLDRASFFRDAERDIVDALDHGHTLTLLRNAELRLVSRPGESEADFEARCMAAAEDGADEDAGKLRDRFESRLRTLERRMTSSERRVRELEADVDRRRQDELLQGAGQVLSMFLGGRKRTRGLSGLSRRRSATRGVQTRLESALDKFEEDREAIVELEAELADELDEIWEEWREKAERIEPLEVPLEKDDIRVDEVALFWAPVAEG
ncbi:MAG TPA: DUF87 domain-containing protein [Longimicrobiales bacterium]|nr:DUF87 domain-containing protein [Longimicrobiales bacterium]